MGYTLRKIILEENSNTTHPRRKAREATMQALYALEINNGFPQDVLELCDDSFNNSDNDNEFKLPSNFAIKTDKGNLIIKYSKMINNNRHKFQVRLPENYNLEEEYNKFLPKLYQKFPNLQEINN